MNVDNVLSTKVRSISEIFSASHGFVVPEYQRSYQWTETNIKQLFEDVVQTIQLFARSSNTDQEIRFLGSIITISHERQYSNYGSLQPAVSHEIVDGQQRLTTFSLVGVILRKKLDDALNFMNENADEYSQELKPINELLKNYIRLSEGLYIAKLDDANQKLPYIIRAEEDSWEASRDKYPSMVASKVWQMLGQDETQSARTKQKTNLVVNNLKFIDKYLDSVMRGEVADSGDDEYEDAHKFHTFSVLSRLNELTGGSQASAIRNRIMKFEVDGVDISESDKKFEEIIRLVIFCYFFLKRCHLNHIATRSEHWAFDMFIGLNTVGIPLSAVETFRAYLLERARKTDNQSDGLKSEIKKLFTEHKYGIQKYLEKSDKTAKREKRSKEFVTAFALYFSGEKVGYSINEQRDYLKRSFDTFLQPDDIFVSLDELVERQTTYISKMKGLTRYFVERDAVLDQSKHMFDGLAGISQSEREISVLCIGFLADAKHTIVDSLIARYYDYTILNNTEAVKSFCSAAKATVAFFTLWRSVNGTTGLPDLYRTFMEEKASFTAFSNQTTSDFMDVSELKLKLRSQLEGEKDSQSVRNLLDTSVWVSIAKSSISYKKMKEICKFVLLLTSHDTMSDPASAGLMIESAYGFQKYATYEHWCADELKSIEHVAPQTPVNPMLGDRGWDSLLYGDDKLYDTVGNLVLMPTGFNISASNSGWRNKWIYYNYLALSSPEARDKFEHEVVENYGVTLDIKIITELKKSKYAGHMHNIVAVRRDGDWSAALVEQRTERMLTIFHKRMLEWLN